MFAGDIVHQLQDALDGALSGIEYDDQGDAVAAASSFRNAIGSIRCALEFMGLEQEQALQPMVHVVCESLMNTFSRVAQVLEQESGALEYAGCSIADNDILNEDGDGQQQCNPNQMDAPVITAFGAGHTASAVLGRHGGAGAIAAAPAKHHQHQHQQQKGNPRIAAVLEACLQHVSGSLDDLAGLESVKAELREAVYLPMLHPELFNRLRRPPSNFLLYGPPGTGKTTLVQKTAAEAGLPLLSISPSSVLSKWAGESEQMLRQVFKAAKALQPAIIFIDEVDSLAASRGGGGDDQMSRRLLTELLLQMTAVREGQLVFVFAATNRIKDCDPAVTRRFHRRIEIPIPDVATRRAYFDNLRGCEEIQCDLTDKEVDELAVLTEGYSGADLEVLVQATAMAPVREFCEANKTSLRKSVQENGRTSPNAHDPVVLRPLAKADFVRTMVTIGPSCIGVRCCFDKEE